MLCGGGKDSLVSMKLLERARVDYDAFIYSHSTYGRGAVSASARRPTWWRTASRDGCTGPGCSTTRWTRRSTSCIRSSASTGSWPRRPSARTGRRCPWCSSTGSPRWRSASREARDEHNLVWDRTGEEINYLWGMSAAAEQLLHAYVQRELLANVTMFHLLRPIYDINVFSLLWSRSRRGAAHPLVRAAETMVLSLRQVPLRMDELRRLAPARDRQRHVRRQPLRSVGEPDHPPQDARTGRATSRPTASAR